MLWGLVSRKFIEKYSIFLIKEIFQYQPSEKNLDIVKSTLVICFLYFSDILPLAAKRFKGY